MKVKQLNLETISTEALSCIATGACSQEEFELNWEVLWTFIENNNIPEEYELIEIKCLDMERKASFRFAAIFYSKQRKSFYYFVYFLTDRFESTFVRHDDEGYWADQNIGTCYPIIPDITSVTAVGGNRTGYSVLHQVTFKIPGF